MKKPPKLKPLRNWATLNRDLMKMNEPAVARLLDEERKGLKRLTFLFRIHARLNKLRRERERNQMVKSL